MTQKLPLLFIPSDYFKPNETLIVAVSGGVDSMVLLSMVRSLKNKIIVAHVNHQVRKESNEEYMYLKDYCLKHNLVFEGYTLSKKQVKNFQSYARKERYNFFLNLSKKYNSSRLLLAHHKDDQVETLCMRYIHSRHILDFTAMEPISTFQGITLIRPFLSLSKTVLLDYANTNDVFYFEDSTNKDTRYTRNRFRHQVIPKLKAVNSNFENQVLELSKSVSELKNLIQKHVDYWLVKFPNKIPINDFLSFHPLLQEELLKALLQKANEKVRSRSFLQELIKQLKSTPHFSYTINKNYILRKEYGFFFLSRISLEDYKHFKIDGFGEVNVSPFLSFVFTPKKEVHISSNYTVLWYNDIVFPLYLRTRRNGDYIYLSYGHKKLKNLFIDYKVPLNQRNEEFLLANEKEVLWIPFLKLSKHQSPLRSKIYIYEVRHVSK